MSATATIAVAVAARWALTPLLGGGYPFITLYPALIVAGALGGWVGGGVALVLSTAAGAFFFIPPAWSFDLKSSANTASLVVYALSGGLGVSVAALLRSAAERLAEREAEAHATAERLQESFATQSLLMREVNHRARNLLAVVQAMVRLTPRDDVNRFAGSLTGRIQALANAHGLLSDRGWSGAPLRDIVEIELRPFATGADQLAIDGPAVTLKPEAVQPAVLVFHELATNAAKYGGLSTPQASVRVRWRRDEDDGVVVDWIEEGGPPVQAPDRQGFGSDLIRATLAGSQGDFRPTWAPGGLTCVIRLPKTMIEASPAG